ncbi:4Fe-4S single cluster domain-containing protein [Nonlabens xiamenensis]|uniref:4Fe-4S single cluster domain-containing protein n=1 Tax=Nonlabens xiamenensis TaxID=2341043 RepID=UPI000F60C445|nr:4Fe-4S single cluster domain-containing protein [Nonlabens xiamenensis]
MKIEISRLHFPVTTLGPGKRIGIWFQGCSIHCTGCISVDTWQFGINSVSLDEVKLLLSEWLPKSDGITITGGEPFDQEAAFFELLEFLRPYQQSVLVYSGYSFQELQKKVEMDNGWIDVLISEPYDHTQPQTKALMGSDNQQMHMLTPLGEMDFNSFQSHGLEKKLDVHFEEDRVWMTGIPSNGMTEIVKSAQDDRVFLRHTQGAIKKKES